MKLVGTSRAICMATQRYFMFVSLAICWHACLPQHGYKLSMSAWLFRFHHHSCFTVFNLACISHLLSSGLNFVYLGCYFGLVGNNELQTERRAKYDSRLTESRYEGVQKQTDDSQRERHRGYRSSQRSLLLPDLHHHSSTCCRGPGHGFGPKIVPSLYTPLLCCPFFLCHLSFFLFLCLVYVCDRQVK